MTLVKYNANQFDRDIRELKSRIFKVAGRRLNEEISKAFEGLVRETPQWSGTTASSWRMGFNAPEVNSVKEKRKKGEALQAGMSPAVDEALSNSVLVGDLEQWLQKDLTVTNGSESFISAEEGPVRSMHQTGTFDKFTGVVNGIIIDLNDEIYG